MNTERDVLKYRIMLRDVQQDTLGRRLTPEAQHRAAEFATNTWRGYVIAGDAVKAGIEHVTRDILRK